MGREDGGADDAGGRWPAWLEERREALPEPVRRAFDVFMTPAAPSPAALEAQGFEPPPPRPGVRDAWRALDKEETAARVAKRTLAIGGVGALWGGLLSFKHNAPVRSYMSAMGTNFSVGAFLYFSLLESSFLVRPRGREDPLQYGAVGAVTGTTLVGMFGSPNRLPGAFVAGGAVAVLGYFAAETFQLWRVRRGQEIRSQYKERIQVDTSADVEQQNPEGPQGA